MPLPLMILSVILRCAMPLLRAMLMRARAAVIFAAVYFTLSALDARDDNARLQRYVDRLFRCRYTLLPIMPYARLLIRRQP